MKHTFLAGLFFLSVFCNAKEGLKKITVGIHFSPEYSFRMLTAEKDFEWMKDLRDDFETPKFGYSLGPEFTGRFSKIFSGTVGINISNKGCQTKYNDLIYNDPEPNAPVRIRSRYSYLYLEVPLKLNYQIFDSSAFFISAGVVPSFLVYEKTTRIYEKHDGSKSRKSDDNILGSGDQEKIGASAYLGIGYYIPLKSWSAIKVEPFFKCEFAPHYNSNIKEYFYSAGIDIGFYFRKGK